jgi:hypothetical protein
MDSATPLYDSSYQFVLGLERAARKAAADVERAASVDARKVAATFGCRVVDLTPSEWAACVSAGIVEGKTP